MRYNSKPIPTNIAFALLIFIIFGFSALSAEPFTPVFQPSLELGKNNSSIKIDGKITDGEWSHASVASNFVECYPGKNLEPAVKTVAYLTYDDDNLYIAFDCYDDPSQVRATMCQRDLFAEDDDVFVILDTYGNATWAYELFVNPYGIQKDYLWSNIHGDDQGFDLIWEAAGSLTDSGYQVEIAIPFASMRFPNKDSQNWKINLGRSVPREEDKQYSWSAFDYDDHCRVCQYGTVNGIKDVQPGKGIEILPSLIASENGGLPDYDPSSKWENEDIESELSIGGKYSISSDVTMEAAYNPDFSQIEADAAQISVNSTISLFYPERRPFFQEGRDIFQTLFNSFYTRTVNDPQFAAKLTGRMGQYNVGFLSAYDENTPYIIPLSERSLLVNTGKSTVNVLRATKAFEGDHHLGFIITDRRFDGGGYGTILSADGSFRLSPKYSFTAQVIASMTEEQDDSSLSEGLEGITFADGKHTAAFDGESYVGDAVIAQFGRSARNWSFNFDYNHVSPSYRTETGYDPWNDYHNFSVYTDYDMYPETGLFSMISPQLYIDNRWDFGGGKKWNRASATLYSDLRWAQTYIGTTYQLGTEVWSGVEFNDLWDWEIYTGSQFNDAIGYGVDFGYSTDVARWLLEKGHETYFYFALNLKPVDRFTIEPTINYVRSIQVNTDEELYRELIGRTRFQLQVNKQFSARLVLQYVDSDDDYWEIDPLLTYRINPFTVFYAGSTHDINELVSTNDGSKIWKQTSQQFFIKLQYLFRT